MTRPDFHIQLFMENGLWLII